MKLVLDLKKPFKLVDQVRIDETPVHNAVREALVNCLVNADFYQGWSVVIEKYPDRIVMANPGTIITGKKQMLKGGISQPRNKGLFKMFNLIGYGEHAGSGVPDIYKAWRDEGLQLPTVEEFFGEGNPDRTVLTLPLLSAQNTNGTVNDTVFDTEKDTENDTYKYSVAVRNYINKCPNKKRTTALKLIRSIMDDSHITLTDMAQKYGISESTVKRYIKDFQEKGILKRKGSDKSGEWIVI